MKKTIIFSILLLTTLVIMSSVLANSVTRTVGSNQVTYTVSSTDPKWGVTIEDTSSCFTGGKYQALMLSTSGNTKTVTVSSGICLFSGNYQFGNGAIVDFNGNDVTDDTGSSIPWIWIIITVIAGGIIYFIIKK